MFMGVSEMWILCRRGLTKRAVPFHRIVNVLDISVIDVLPAIHALTRCDFTNTIETKRDGLKTRRNRQKQDVDFAWKRTFNVGCHGNC